MNGLRVASWNIRLGVESSLGTVGRGIAGLAADIVALQEVGQRWVMGEGPDQTAQLAAAAGLPYHRFFPALWSVPCDSLRGLGERLWSLEQAEREDRDVGTLPLYGVALLSRFPITATSQLPLPQRADEPRTLARAQLALPRGDLTVFVTHLSFREEDLCAQAPVAAGAFRGAPGPTLLLGDLNAGPDAAALAPIFAAADTPPPADGAPTFPAAAPTQRLDHILARGLTPTALPQPVTLHGSDHLPVVAEFA